MKNPFKKIYFLVEKHVHKKVTWIVIAHLHFKCKFKQFNNSGKNHEFLINKTILYTQGGMALNFLLLQRSLE